MASSVKQMLKKSPLIGDLGFIKGGGNINWFPGHMAAATRAICDRLKLCDLVIEVRDARIPMSSANAELQPMLVGKRRVIALNKKDLANQNIMNKWIRHFESSKQDCLAINALNKGLVKKLLSLVEYKLKEVISREPTLLVMVVGVPNVGKSALINNIHQIASERLAFQEKKKRATVGPLPGVTQDIAGFKIAHQPSVYLLDTPGVLVPSIPDIETGLKLAAAGSVKDSVVGEERIAQYLLAVLNIRGTPLKWKCFDNQETEGHGLNNDNNKPLYDLNNLTQKRKRPLISRSDVYYIEDMVNNVKGALHDSLTEFNGRLEDERELGDLIDQQFEVLQRALKIPHQTSEARTMVSKKFLTLFRTGRLGPFTLDDVPP